MISVLIVEDNKFMREGWETFINYEDEMSVIGSFENCEDALQSSDLPKANIILMDIGLPGISGIEGVKKIKELHPEISIIMATVFDDDEHIFEALKAGADGYLMKKSTPEELIKAIRDVQAGGSPLTPNVAKKVLDVLYKTDKQGVKLTNREHEVLKELSKGKSYAAIGKSIFLSEDGIRHHVRNIYRKLQVNNKTEAVSFAFKTGLISLLISCLPFF